MHFYFHYCIFCRLSGGIAAAFIQMPSKHELEAFEKCVSVIIEILDLDAILPYLKTQNLLTQMETETLMSMHDTRVNKILFLTTILPRKGDKFFEKFIVCLLSSKTGTGHDHIVKSLTMALDEVKRTCPEEGIYVIIIM